MRRWVRRILKRSKTVYSIEDIQIIAQGMMKSYSAKLNLDVEQANMRIKGREFGIFNGDEQIAVGELCNCPDDLDIVIKGA